MTSIWASQHLRVRQALTRLERRPEFESESNYRVGLHDLVQERDGSTELFEEKGNRSQELGPILKKKIVLKIVLGLKFGSVTCANHELLHIS